jgi:predicted secreted protein
VVALLNQTIQVNLKGNPTTGFGWSIAATNGESVVSLGPYTYTSDNPGLTGAGGTFTFPFQAKQAGQTSFTFTYQQPWNPQGYKQTVTLTIQVKAEEPGLRLSLTRVAEQVVLTWPSDSAQGYFLEGTLSLAPAQWTALNAAPLLEGSQYKVTLGTLGQSLFFRLRK